MASVQLLCAHPLSGLDGEYLPLALAAGIVGVSSDTVRRWLRVGVRGEILQSRRVGTRIYISRADLQGFLDRISSEEAK